MRFATRTLKKLFFNPKKLLVYLSVTTRCVLTISVIDMILI